MLCGYVYDRLKLFLVRLSLHAFTIGGFVVHRENKVSKLHETTIDAAENLIHDRFFDVSPPATDLTGDPRASEIIRMYLVTFNCTLEGVAKGCQRIPRRPR